MRKHNLNENFFKTWSKEMAYTFGFIIADGCISGGDNHQYLLSIGLKSIDRHILESFCNLMGYTGPIYDYLPKNQSQLAINSKEIFHDLSNLGLTPRKSLTLEWLDNIPEEYMSHYLRGFFDGDGSVFPIKHPSQKRPYIGINFTGTKPFLKELKKELNKRLNNDYGYIRKIIVKSGEYFQLVYSGDETIKRLLDYLYQDSDESTRLSRKYKIYEDFYSQDRIYYPSKSRVSHTNKSVQEHQITAFGITQSLNEWAEEEFCECTRQQLYYRVVKMGLEPEYAITTKRLPAPEGQNISIRKYRETLKSTGKLPKK